MLLLANPKALLAQLKQASSAKEVLQVSAAFIQKWLQCEEVFLSYGEGEVRQGNSENQNIEPIIRTQNLTRPLPSGPSLPLFVGNVRTSQYLTHALRSELDARGITSFVVVPIFEGEIIRGLLECHFLKLTQSWPREVCYCFFQLAEQISLAIERVNLPQADENELNLKLQLFDRLIADQAPCAACIVDSQLKLKTAVGSWSQIIGADLEDIFTNKDLRDSILRYEDPILFSRKLQDISLYARPYTTKLSIHHESAGEMRTISIKATPLDENSDSNLLWEISAFDQSDNLRIQSALAMEQKRVRAFYELSRLLEMKLDVAVFCMRALSAMNRATDSDAGFVCLRDFHMSRMNIVAVEALPQNYVDALVKVINLPCLVKFSSEHGVTIVVNNIQQDERTANDILRIGSMKSALLVPIVLENLILGTMVFLSRKLHHFSSDHAEFITACSNQIALKVRSKPTQPSSTPTPPRPEVIDRPSKGEVR